MDNEQFSQSPVESTVSDDSQDLEGGGNSERVFDITADLNISPVEDAPPVAPVPIAPIFKKPLAKPVVQSEPTLRSPVPQNTPSRPVPLQDFSASLKKAQGIEPNSVPAMKVMPSAPPAAVAPTQPVANAPVQNSNLKPLRTYEGDVAEVMSRKRTSFTSMAIAESRKNEGNESIKAEAQEQAPSRHTSVKLLLILLSLIFVGGGIVGAYYLYSKSPLAPAPTPVQQQAQPSTSLIPADSRTTIAIDNLDPLKVLARIRTEVAKPQNPGSIREIIFTKATDGQTARVSGPEMLSTLDISAPDVLTRSLTAPWMLGIYADQSGQKNVFVVVTTNFFQNAFAGMLQWENVMADDLKQYLYSGPALDIANVAQNVIPLAQPATTTATSTSKVASTTSKTGSLKKTGTASSTASIATTTPPQIIAPYFTLRGKFQDRIIKNKDVREFVTDSNQVLFLYSFLDNNKLAITVNEATLAEMINRLEKQAFVR